MNVEQANRLLRDGLGLSISAAFKRYEDLKLIAQSVDALSPGNAPTVAAKQLLNQFGFCVLTRDQVHAIVAALAIHGENTDFETDDEKKRFEELLDEVEKEATCAIRR